MINFLVRSTDNNGTVAFNNFIQNVYQPMVTNFPSTGPQPTYRFVAVSQGAECGQGVLPSGAQMAGVGATIVWRFTVNDRPLPGNRGFFFTGSINALPSSAAQRICYFKLEYRIRLFNIINISVPIIDKSINSPVSILPYDSGAGGTESWNRQQDLAIGVGYFGLGKNYATIRVMFNGYIQYDEWCFVPTASALDATTFNSSTLNTTFVGAVTPRTLTRSEKFITQEPFTESTVAKFNRRHTFFTARNSQFMFNEMQGISNTLNCSSICTNNTLVELNGPATTGCSQNLLTYTSPITTNVNSYTWSVGNSLTIVSGQGTSTIMVRPEPNGVTSSRVSVNVATTCNGTNIINSFSKNVTIESGGINGTIQYTQNNSTQTVPLNTYNSIPALNITVSASLPGTNTLTWTPVGTPPSFYQATNGGQTFTIQSSVAGCFSFKVRGTGTCGLRERTITFCLSNSSFRLSPNPTSESFVVLADEEISLQSIKEIRVLDRNGIVLLNRILTQGYNGESFDVSNIRPDIYTVMINDGALWNVLQLIIQR
ncbi:MAG: hypothetical protein HC892_22130 [Saprospiraceae bacterium]|nr:hypothetical protein [Saprospiraceae bacterium]